MKTCIALGILVLSSVIPVLAKQPKPNLSAEGGGPDDRASARILYWNSAKNVGAGEFAIDYGRPVWKSVYEDPEKFDQMTKGKVWRMGSNFWTTLDTCVPLKISGRSVPVGYYYLGLRRSDDGAMWYLAFIDPAKVRAARTDAFNIEKAPISFEVPMAGTRAASKAEKLTIELIYPKDNIYKATLNISWGTLALTAPIEVALTE